MSIKEHYDHHLSHFYSWMTGDFVARCSEFKKLLINHSIFPRAGKVALDLGAGHGIQSIPLAEVGFQVIAVDFNQHLLDELKRNANDLTIKIVNNDIRNVSAFAVKPELVVCCGDTLLHLGDKSEIASFLCDIYETLDDRGMVILSFRDYSTELKGTNRFIPVKSDYNRILTCMIEYKDEFLDVTDLVWEKIETGWGQRVSTYTKVRLLPIEVTAYLEKCHFTILDQQLANNMVTIIARK